MGPSQLPIRYTGKALLDVDKDQSFFLHSLLGFKSVNYQSLELHINPQIEKFSKKLQLLKFYLYSQLNLGWNHFWHNL